MLRKGIIQIASSSMLEEHLLKNTSCHEEHICTCLLLAVVCAMAGNSDDKQMVPHAASNPRKRPASEAQTKNWEPTRKHKRRSVRFDHIEEMEQQKELGCNNCSFLFFFPSHISVLF